MWTYLSNNLNITFNIVFIFIYFVGVLMLFLLPISYPQTPQLHVYKYLGCVVDTCYNVDLWQMNFVGFTELWTCSCKAMNNNNNNNNNNTYNLACFCRLILDKIRGNFAYFCPLILSKIRGKKYAK